MRTLSLIGAGLLALLPAAAAAQGPVEKGAALFTAQKCSLCHALDGKGNAKGALDGVGSKLTADQMRQWLTTPAEMAAKASATRKPPMKSFANLSKEELDALIAFLMTKKKA